ncbi:sulfotransferase domain-containing protein [Aphanothece sacrum]|uniref:Sulfotransferase n=1 Tax=Aphanothece sacrum FPU1 TaxID=1920663 RepID=A0A401IJ79_APHSA|nr:sulfotransferase domain-containing protein [Aphanothece sacrum]GBF81362.1 sulfotransferase [Aphanothece sacrum FPU1]GBF86117.1 sulfotransferase [Aphanothece sacrum FPU3]
MKQLIKKLIYPVYSITHSQPDFLIIGTQRSGVTSLYQYLKQHSQILVTNPLKETYYFDVPENINKGFGWYLSHFPNKIQKGNKLTFEASPSYLYYPQIPQLIKQYLGNIKMIALLRNPSERAYSAWQMFHSYSRNSYAHLRTKADTRTFSQAIEEELNPDSNSAKYSYDYLKRGQYFNQLENYYNHFDREKILILSFDQLREDLSSLLNNLCNFLEIESFSLEQITKLQQEKYAVTSYEKNPNDEEVIAKLQNYFAGYNEKLYEVLGQDFKW